jgi:hypothetical protein
MSHWTCAINALLLAGLAGCMGYVPGRQTFWDHKVNELCAQDGGMAIYQRIRIPKADVDRGVQPITWSGSSIGQGQRFISTTDKKRAHPNALVYSEEKVTWLREANPSVRRVELQFRRSNDQAVIGKWVYYSRVGGDIPTGIAHDSSYVCPDYRKMSGAINDLFVVD